MRQFGWFPEGSTEIGVRGTRLALGLVDGAKRVNKLLSGRRPEPEHFFEAAGLGQAASAREREQRTAALYAMSREMASSTSFGSAPGAGV